MPRLERNRCSRGGFLVQEWQPIGRPSLLLLALGGPRAQRARRTESQSALPIGVAGRRFESAPADKRNPGERFDRLPKHLYPGLATARRTSAHHGRPSLSCVRSNARLIVMGLTTRDSGCWIGGGPIDSSPFNCGCTHSPTGSRRLLRGRGIIVRASPTKHRCVAGWRVCARSR